MTSPHTCETSHSPYVVLVLQGGGALGAYHLGVIQALQKHHLHPNWICGTSIGAMNAAVMAGNAIESRVTQLEQLWVHISYPDYLSFNRYEKLSSNVQRYINTLSMTQTAVLGQPNFFRPRFPSPTMIRPVDITQASVYDASPLVKTVEKFTDFSLINSPDVRLSLGATDIHTSALTVFNNWEAAMTAEHVLACASLPPAFGAVRLGGRYYWDGGCAKQTLLDTIIASPSLSQRRVLVLVVDLWNSTNPHLPDTLDDVSWRQTEIQWAGRTDANIHHHIQTANLVQALRAAGSEAALAEDLRPYLQFEQLDIAHLTYQSHSDPMANSAAEFSRAAIQSRRSSGYQAMDTAIANSPWMRTIDRAERDGVSLPAAHHRITLGEHSTAAKTDVA